MSAPIPNPPKCAPATSRLPEDGELATHVYSLECRPYPCLQMDQTPNYLPSPANSIRSINTTVYAYAFGFLTNAYVWL